MKELKLKACVRHGAYHAHSRDGCPQCYDEAPTVDDITLELANGEPCGAHWIYTRGEMRDWYVKSGEEGRIAQYKKGLPQ